MTKRRFALFATVTVALATGLSTAVLLAGDVYLHRKYTDLVGLNVWGYRGPVVGRKAPDEWRLAVLGESTAFGYGVHWTDAFPARLERLLNAEGSGRPVTVLNLAYNNEGAHSYRFTLRDYEYLDYDAVLFYSGYNDLGDPNTQVFRHESAVFRFTGYYPIFPMIFAEKAMAIRWNGRLEDAYFGRKTTFKPNITERATATALETAVAISRSLSTQLGAVSLPHKDRGTHPEGGSCGKSWAYYCGEMYAGVRLALEMNKQVLLVKQPYIIDYHEDQQRQLRAFLDNRFGAHPRLHYADLTHAVDLKDSTFAYDGMHLNATGNGRIAAALVPHVRQLIPQRK